MIRQIAVIATAAAFTVAGLGSTVPALAAQQVAQPASISAPAATYQFTNCTQLNKVYRHGVGRSNAKDKTSGKRVTNFKHSTKLYNQIVGHRRGLDRDHDGIACEKH